MSAAAWERADWTGNPGALTWEGSCDAWAIASLYESEPTTRLQVDSGLSFSVAAQKAILVKDWELTEGKRIFGTPYRGGRESVWGDPNPASLHRFLLSEMMDQGRPVILDKDPGIPVWNTPIFQAELALKDDPSNPHVMHVHAWLKGVDPLFGDPNEVGTHISVIELRYRLEGQRGDDGSLQVMAGFWETDRALGIDSVEFHPDFLVGLPPKGEVVNHSSRNPGIQPAAVDALRLKAQLSIRNP